MHFIHSFIYGPQENLTNRNNVVLRNFSAELIREFVIWSIQQEEQDDERRFSNTGVVLKQICLLCLRPSPYKKLGNM